MSLINEALNNIHKKNSEPLINPSMKVKPGIQKQATRSSLQNVLILVISFALIISIFYATYYFKINSYISGVKVYFLDKSRQIVNDISEMKTENKKTNSQKAKTQVVKEHGYSLNVQTEYYNAMNLLNEGNVDLARESLDIILKNNPDFKPAQQAISMLNSEYK